MLEFIEDIHKNCIDCGDPFTIDREEQEFIQKKGWTLSNRCKPCRMAKKARFDRQIDNKPFQGIDEKFRVQR